MAGCLNKIEFIENDMEKAIDLEIEINLTVGKTSYPDEILINKNAVMKDIIAVFEKYNKPKYVRSYLDKEEKTELEKEIERLTCKAKKK